MNKIKDNITVIIPAYGNEPNLEKVVNGVLSQTIMPEKIIISHSGDHEPRKEGALSDEHVTILHQNERLFAGAARNKAAQFVETERIAFLDADVLPEPNWLQNLVKAADDQGEQTILVGSIGYASRGGYWGMVLWWIEFSSAHRYMPERKVFAGASANMLVSRKLFTELGGFPENFQFSGDVNFQGKQLVNGGQVRFVPDACVKHFNKKGIRNCYTHLYNVGFGSARVRKSFPLPGQLAVKHPFLSLPLTALRFLQICYRAIRFGSSMRLNFLFHTPGIMLALPSWGLGFYRAAKMRTSNIQVTSERQA